LNGADERNRPRSTKQDKRRAHGLLFPLKQPSDVLAKPTNKRGGVGREKNKRDQYPLTAGHAEHCVALNTLNHTIRHGVTRHARIRNLTMWDSMRSPPGRVNARTNCMRVER
jgi:hypothetical protein